MLLHPSQYIPILRRKLFGQNATERSQTFVDRQLDGLVVFTDDRLEFAPGENVAFAGLEM